MKFYLIFFSVLSFTFSAFAQNSGYQYQPYVEVSTSDSGYYYTITGLKVRAFITVSFSAHSKDLGTTLISVKTPDSKKRVVLKTNEVTAFTIGKDSFAVIKSFSRSDLIYYSKDFARVVQSGHLTLYSHCQSVSAPTGGGGMTTTGVECFYYIKKRGSLYRFKRGDFKGRASFMFGDDTELMNKITKKELGFNDLEQIVAEYNAWYEKTHPVE